MSRPDDERQPLLGAASSSQPTGTNRATDDLRSGYRSAEVRNELNVAQVELPSAILPQSPTDGPRIPCKVCGEIIALNGLDSSVVRCSKCSENTPIRSAPLGKKYLRCTCRCLLICRATAQRVACPRPHCQRVLFLAPNLPDSFPGYMMVGLCSVSCGHCNQTFMFNTLSNALARCPSCRKVTSVGVEFARSRALVFLILSVLSAIIGIGITLATYKVARNEKAWLAAYVICFLLFVAFLLRAIYYCTLKVSQVNNPSESGGLSSMLPDSHLSV